MFQLHGKSHKSKCYQSRTKTKKCRKLPTISLTNCIAKICETAVKNIVLAHCEKNDVFGEMQSAYRRNCCTTDNLLKTTNFSTQISQFADDYALYYRSRSCRKIQEKLQYSLDKLIKWCEKMIRINPGKTNFMLFKNPSKKVSSLDLFINGTRIKDANSIKFLGVNLTPHLKWNEHCKSLMARANKKI